MIKTEFTEEEILYLWSNGLSDQFYNELNMWLNVSKNFEQQIYGEINNLKININSLERKCLVLEQLKIKIEDLNKDTESFFMKEKHNVHNRICKLKEEIKYKKYIITRIKEHINNKLKPSIKELEKKREEKINYNYKKYK